MSEPVETFVALDDREYQARFVDGRLDEFRMSQTDDEEVRDRRMAELLDLALSRHGADVLAARGGRRQDAVLDQFVAEGLQRVHRQLAESASLRREVQERIGQTAGTEGADPSGNVRVTVTAGRVTAVEIAAPLRARGQAELTRAVGEALSAALSPGVSATRQQMHVFEATVSPGALAAEVEEFKSSLQKGRTSW